MSSPAAPAPAATAARPRRTFARWRPSSAIGHIVLALVASQLVAGGVMLAAGGRDALLALALVLADLVILGVVVLFARRGAERLTPTTLGIRRTRFWPAFGWTLAIYFGIGAAGALWAILAALLAGGGNGGGDGTAHVAPGIAVLVLLGAAVTAPIVEEISFRGYLFPAVTRWRGPWIGALVTALLFGAAHALVYPPLALPLMAFFGFGTCLLFWFTGSLLPGIALHAFNNALVVSIALDLGWGIPLALIGCVGACLALLLPMARERPPHEEAT